MRVGTKQKKVDVNIPSLEDFVHHIYINAARKIYTNVYLFEMGISSLKSQKNSRELEIIIKECILQTVRETIPVEELLKLYMSETVENATEVHEREEIISQEPVIDKTIAGNISQPEPMSAKQLAEEAETLSKIKAASFASTPEVSISNGSSGSSVASGVSFNMNNNQVIPIENISSDSRNDSSKDYDDDYDDDDDDDDGDDGDDDDSVKLNIGENVELSVDPFPSDDEDNDSNIDLKIEEIPMIDDF
jgi:hypothetical protein